MFQLRLWLYVVFLVPFWMACSSIYSDPLSDGGGENDGQSSSCWAVASCRDCVETTGCGYCIRTNECRQLDDYAGCDEMIDSAHSSDCPAFDCTDASNEKACTNGDCTWCHVQYGLCVKDQAACEDAELFFCLNDISARGGCGSCAYEDCLDALRQCCLDKDCAAMMALILTCSSVHASCSACSSLYRSSAEVPNSNTENLLYCISNTPHTDLTPDCLFECITSHCQ